MYPAGAAAGLAAAVYADPTGEHGEADQGDRKQDDERGPGQRRLVGDQVDNPHDQSGGGEQEVPEDDRGGEPGGRAAAGGCPSGPGLLLRHPRRPHRVSPGADAARSGRLVPFRWVIGPYRPLSGRATVGCGGEAHARLRCGDEAVRPGDGPGPVHVLGPAGPADRLPRPERGRQDDGHAGGVRAGRAGPGSGPVARCDGLPRGPGPVRVHAGGAGPVPADAGAGPAGLPRPALRAQARGRGPQRGYLAGAPRPGRAGRGPPGRAVARQPAAGPADRRPGERA